MCVAESFPGRSLAFPARRSRRAFLFALGLSLAGVRGAPALVADAGTAPAGAVPAPELVGRAWLNVTNGAGPSLASRRGHVTIVHFWTFDCVNCRHNLPYYNQWRQRLAGRGLEIIGIHTPETEAERDPAKVATKVKELGIRYPVLLDPERANWNRWQQRYWPAIYVIDKQGRVRFVWEGELEYSGAGGNQRMLELIDGLLRE
jgi:thiol-disulfide isomerase/thioredoxin